MSSQERHLPTASSSHVAQAEMSSRRSSSIIQVQDGPAAAAAAAVTTSSAYTASTANASGLSLAPGSTFYSPWHQQQYPFSMPMAPSGGVLAATQMNFGFPMMVHPSAMTQQLGQPTLSTLVQPSCIPTIPTSTTSNHSPPNSSGRAEDADEFASPSLAVAVSTDEGGGGGPSRGEGGRCHSAKQ